MVHADHSAGDWNAGGETTLYLGEPAGFVVELENGFRLLPRRRHERLRRHAPDRRAVPARHRAACPIGGHFTMGPREAALAVELLGVKHVMPIHYGTFPVLAGTPDQLRSHGARREASATSRSMRPEPGGSVDSTQILVAIVALIASAAAFGLASARAAGRLDRDTRLWFVFGVILGPVALLLLWRSPPAWCRTCLMSTRGWTKTCWWCGADARYLRRPGRRTVEPRQAAVADTRTNGAGPHAPTPERPAPGLPAPARPVPVPPTPTRAPVPVSRSSRRRPCRSGPAAGRGSGDGSATTRRTVADGGGVVGASTGTPSGRRDGHVSPGTSASKSVDAIISSSTASTRARWIA